MLKKDLNFRPRKSHNVQELTPEDCDRRMEYGELMVGWHEDWPKLFENILWSDKAVFHIGGFVNRHNLSLLGGTRSRSDGEEDAKSSKSDRVVRNYGHLGHRPISSA